MIRRLLTLVLLVSGCGAGEVFHVEVDVGGYGDFGFVEPGEEDGVLDVVADGRTEGALDDLAEGDVFEVGEGHGDGTGDGGAEVGPETLDGAADALGDLVEVGVEWVQGLTDESAAGEQPWESLRLLTFAHPGLTSDAFIERCRQTDPDIVTAFGDNEPGPGTVLLYQGPGCADAEHAWLLVHGAGSHADESWVAPPDLLAQGHGQTLIGDGECVYAVTFPHPFGDCFNQAIQLAAATQAVLGDGIAEVTLVAHSKGGIAAVTWLSGYGADARGLQQPAEGQIRRLVLLGVPLGGTDFSFRHPAFNYPAELLNLRMPSSWDEILEWGQWKDVYDVSIYGGAFPGILQITAAWDEVYDLPMWEQDWYTTYYGGQGFVSHSLGIGEAIDLGGGFMGDLAEHPLPAGLPVRIASGGNPMISGVPWESSGPSDGLVFQASAEDLTLIPVPEDLHHFPLANHLDLLHSDAVYEWMTSVP